MDIVFQLSSAMPQIPFFAKSWREYRGLKINAAAREMGMKVSHLSEIEERTHHFDEHDLAAMATLYGIHPAMFFNLDPSQPEDLAVLEAEMAKHEISGPD